MRSTLTPHNIRATTVVVIATSKPGNDVISSAKWNLRATSYIQSKILSVHLIMLHFSAIKETD